MSQNPDATNHIAPPVLSTASGSPIPNIENLLLSAFMENIPDQVYFKDLQSRFIMVSKAKATLDGRKNEDFVGKTDFDFFDKKFAQRAFDDEQRIVSTGEPILQKLEKLTWPDGRVAWVFASKLPWRDQNGKIIGTFGTSRDVTETVEAHKALEESNRQLMEDTRQAGMAEVATGVLHNVGNVLTSINVTANLVSDRYRDSKVTSIFKVCALLREHAADLGGFFANDPRASKLPP